MSLELTRQSLTTGANVHLKSSTFRWNPSWGSPPSQATYVRGIIIVDQWTLSTMIPLRDLSRVLDWIELHHPDKIPCVQSSPVSVNAKFSAWYARTITANRSAKQPPHAA